VTLHFAYGANMSRAVMRRHAPAARPLGVAQLIGHRFVVTADGYASVAQAPGQAVYGVVWRLTARDRVTLDAWENIAGGLYRAETLPVLMRCRRMPALVYVARPRGGGRPKPGYMELVVSAGQEWELPAAYLQSLLRWSLPRALRDSTSNEKPAVKIREFG
jgi:hypothetical protein